MFFSKHIILLNRRQDVVPLRHFYLVLHIHNHIRELLVLLIKVLHDLVRMLLVRAHVAQLGLRVVLELLLKLLYPLLLTLVCLDSLVELLLCPQLLLQLLRDIVVENLKELHSFFEDFFMLLSLRQVWMIVESLVDERLEV